MTDKDSDQSKTRLAMISEMQKLFVYQLASGAAGKESASQNVTATVYPLDPSQWNFSIVNITITVFASLVIFCTLSGNALVIVAVIKERRLRKVSNSFIINLAVSDVLVGVLVMPLALLYQLHGRWAFSTHLCHFWVSMDVICCTASITSLCAISYDRYNAITRPLRYARKRTRRRAFYLILVIWVYSACIALPPFLGWGDPKDGVESEQCKISQHAGYTLYSTIGAFYLPLSFMLFAYVCIFRETSKRTRQWRCGPGSSKMISERDCQGISIPMASLVEEREPISSPLSAVTTSSCRNDLTKTSSGPGAFFRNSPKESCQLIHRGNAIAEENERTHSDHSSSSDCSATATSPPPLLRTTALVNRACRTTLVSGRKLDHPPLRRTYGSFPHKLIRQVSNLPSSDSSTATTSSSDILLEQPSVERRFPPAILRQNADLAFTGRKRFVLRRLNDCGQEGIRSYTEDSLRSVNSIASSPSPKLARSRYENHVTPPVDSSEVVVGQITSCTAAGVVKTRHKRKISLSQEKRAAKTLSVVLGCFIVCWLPFFVVALLKPLCVTCHWPPAVSDVVLWLGYCNSALNPIIYTFFNKDFRFAFRNVLCCACHYFHCRRRRRRYHNPAFL